MTEINIERDATSAVVEVRDGDVRDELRDQLNLIDEKLDGDIAMMRVEIVTEGGDLETAPVPASAGTARPNRSGGGGSIGPQDQPATKDVSDRGWNAIEEDERTESNFKTGSSYHVVASILYESDDTWRPKDIQSTLDEIPSGTISGAISKLYRRKVIDRKKEEMPNGGGWNHVYYLTDHGRDLIEEKGTLTMEEWLNS